MKRRDKLSVKLFAPKFMTPLRFYHTTQMNVDNIYQLWRRKRTQNHWSGAVYQARLHRDSSSFKDLRDLHYSPRETYKRSKYTQNGPEDRYSRFICIYSYSSSFRPNCPYLISWPLFTRVSFFTSSTFRIFSTTTLPLQASGKCQHMICDYCRLLLYFI